MVLRNLGIGLSIMVICISAGVVEIELDKKVKRSLKSVWPDKVLRYKAVDEDADVNGTVYRVYESNEELGYFVLDIAKSKYDVFDFFVAFDLEGQILKPDILVYREDYGGEICSKRWLRQFIGLDANNDMRLGKDVQNISGATISCRSASMGFKQASTRIAEFIESNGAE